MKMMKLGVAFATLSLLAGHSEQAQADSTPECNEGALPNSTECGTNSLAQGDGATAVGNAATANGILTTAVGTQAQATADRAQAYGGQARATSLQAVAVGYQAQAGNSNAVALGPRAIATGLNASAIGPFSNAGGMGAIAVGNGANASGAGSSAAGVLSVASGAGSSAFGGVAVASGENATAVGRRASATGASSIAVGLLAFAGATDATAVGNAANAGFANSTALGANALATGANQVVLGSAGTHVRLGDIAASTAAQNTTSRALATIDANGILGRDTTLLPAIALLQNTSSMLGGRVDELFDLRQADRRDMRQGIAAAVAMGQASMPSEPGRTAYVINSAVFRGSFAVAGSFLHRLDTEVPLAIGVGFSFAGNKNNAAKFGIAGEF